MRDMSQQPLLLAHRGAHRGSSVQENSIAAFDRALEEGCDGFELDVRSTRCGCAIVCHDAKLNGVAVSQAVRNQLPRLPRIQEVVRRYGARGFLDIELKTAGLETRLLSTLREYPPERDYVVSSFLPEVVLELKARSEVVPVGIICGKASQLVEWRKLPVDYVIVHRSLVTRRLVQLVHSAGRKIFVWIVNDKRSMLQLAGWGVDAIISDKTELLVKTLRSSEPSGLHA
jgi:glycerophosphoryl diester phosphodiesterase